MLLKKIIVGTLIAGISGGVVGGIVKAFGSKKTVLANLEAAQAIATAEINKNGFMSEATQKNLEEAQAAAKKYVNSKR